jgi:four helix bundle protein
MIFSKPLARLLPWRFNMANSTPTFLENLECWQHAKKLAVDMYQISMDGSLNNDCALRDQLRKSALSIATQIANGRERRNTSEFIQFLRAAKASAAELRTQLIISREIGYLSEGEYLDFEDKINRISAMIGGLIRAIRKRQENQQGEQRENGQATPLSIK